MEITIMCGLSGSGKSTYLKDERCVCSTDKYIEDYANNNNYTYAQAFNIIKECNLFSSIEREFYDDIRYYLYMGVSFSIDRTNLTKNSRKYLIDYIKEVHSMIDTYCLPSIHINAVVMYVNQYTLQKQLKDREYVIGKHIPDCVIYNQRRSFEIPTHDEGLHDIHIVTPPSLTEWINEMCDEREFINHEEECCIGCGRGHDDYDSYNDYDSYDDYNSYDDHDSYDDYDSYGYYDVCDGCGRK